MSDVIGAIVGGVLWRVLASVGAIVALLSLGAWLLVRSFGRAIDAMDED